MPFQALRQFLQRIFGKMAAWLVGIGVDIGGRDIGNAFARLCWASPRRAAARDFPRAALERNFS
jgi:hypothetical protein